jgi:hypothetical protein
MLDVDLYRIMVRISSLVLLLVNRRRTRLTFPLACVRIQSLRETLYRNT